MAIDASTIRTAQRHLRAGDPVMRQIIVDVGPCTLRPQRDRFAMLVRSIVSQQISTSAARSIQARLEALAQPDGISPDRLAQFDPPTLRTAGISPQKASYLLDLAKKVQSGRVCLRQIGRLSDERVIETLIEVKGIGRWTAKMFLIFALGRPDVLPHDDLGIRAAIRNRYQLAELPDRATCQQIAEPWRPYATLASWYCWRSLEIDRQRTAVPE